MATIGLSMIVKNEAKLIRRCLDSVRPLVDFVVVADTGSEDGTRKIIRDWLSTSIIKGGVVTHKWVNFAHNRNLALTAASCFEPDYIFVIDADDTLEIAPDFDVAAFKAGMDRDVYDLQVKHAGVVHPRPQIFRNKPGYFWVGALHEYLEAPTGFTRAPAPGLTINASIEGSRNADPQKFQKDAAILEKALKTEKTDYLQKRYTFYLAQSYRDALNYEKALFYYLKRSKMGGWDQEIYVSLLEAIRCCTKLGAETAYNKTQGYLNCASALSLGRAEHFHSMSFWCRQIGRNEMGMEVARSGLNLTAPDGLFIEPWIYDYGLRDEYAVNAYWAGQYLESLNANLQLLASPKTPHDMVKRLADNAIACVEKLTTRFTSNTSLVYSD